MPQDQLKQYLAIISLLSSQIRTHYLLEQGYSHTQINRQMCLILFRLCSSSSSFNHSQLLHINNQSSLCYQNIIKEIIQKSVSDNSQNFTNKLLLQLINVLEQQWAIIKENQRAVWKKNQRIMESCRENVEDKEFESRIVYPQETDILVRQRSLYKTPQKKKLFRQYYKPQDNSVPIFHNEGSSSNLFKNVSTSRYEINPEDSFEFKSIYKKQINFYDDSERSRANHRFDFNAIKSRFAASKVSDEMENDNISFEDEEDVLDMDEQYQDDSDVFSALLDGEAKLDTLEKFEKNIRQTLDKTRKLREFISKQINKEEYRHRITQI